MKISAKAHIPSVMLLVASLSAAGASAESHQICEAVEDTALFSDFLYNSQNPKSVLDSNTEDLEEVLSDYEYPQAKRSYKVKVRVLKKDKGRPMNYGDYIL